MRLIRIALFIAVAWSAGLAPRMASAQRPWQRLNLFKRVEVDPKASYMIQREHGPWMIMAATFAGDGAEQQARELVLELRSQHKLESYLHRIEFDHSGETMTGRGVDRYGKPQRMKYLNERNAHSDQFAVLVGNYSSLEDPTAEKELQRIKGMEPKSLDIVELAKSNRKTYQQLVGFRLSQKVSDTQRLQSTLAKQYQGDGKIMVRNSTRQYGPMGSAFLTRNPLLPEDQTEDNIVDKFVYDMNKDVKHSLLNCSGKYSVKVATFTGTVVVDQKQIRRIQQDGSMKSRLAEAALRAHELCEALRIKGYEAYEFHDRCASIVTVGSFDSVGTPRADGKIEINPQVLQTMKRFSVDPITGSAPETLVGIPFDVQALPVVVPRRSFAADYARN